MAAGALAFLAAMAFTGGRRESPQLVPFQAAGLMAAAPRQVDRVEIEHEGQHLALVRSAEGWAMEATGERALPPLAGHVETSLKFMHAAAPVRVLERAEWEATPLADFGLAPAAYTIRLSGNGRQILTARLGALNPQRVMQFARVEGREQLYVMPRFVGGEWERVWDLASTR